jgi:hypothetical protein
MTRLKLLQSSVSLLRVHTQNYLAGILVGLAIDSFLYLSTSIPFCIHIAYSLVSDWAFSDMFPGRRFSAGVFITIPPNLPLET